MKQNSLQPFILRLRICIISFLLVMLCLVLFSFGIKRTGEDIFKDFGLAKPEADKKITGSFLGGYLDFYDFRTAKNIAMGNRAAVVNDLLVYTYQFTHSDAFKKDYNKLKQDNKPKLMEVTSPEDMRRQMIDSYKKSITQLETAVSKATGSTKTIFEKALADSREQLKEAEDPNNAMIVNYAESYKQLVASSEKSYQEQIAEWEVKYPSNEMLFVKQRLNQFLEETRDIDYNAELVVKNSKKVFANPVYEHRSKNWKMAYRAGREVTEPARVYVTRWIQEIK